MTIHLGPLMPGWGSWEWLGQEMIPAFQRWANVETFTYDQPPPKHGTLIVIKHPPPRLWQKSLRASAVPVIYAPVDFYDSLREIDQDASWLTQINLVVVHCHRLLPYFQPYSPVTYLDHPLRFITPQILKPGRTGPILWVGVHSNIPPLAAWLHQHPLSRPLCVLTNHDPVQPSEWGFPANQSITLERWSVERHHSILNEVSAALDIKGDDFRSRHKPPTKALDFLASGLPFAIPRTSCVAEYLMQWGFRVADPSDETTWFSTDYSTTCKHFAKSIRPTLSQDNMAEQWVKLLSSYHSPG